MPPNLTKGNYMLEECLWFQILVSLQFFLMVTKIDFLTKDNIFQLKKNIINNFQNLYSKIR